MVSQSDLLPMTTATRDFELRIPDCGFLERVFFDIWVHVINARMLKSQSEFRNPRLLCSLVQRVAPLAVKVAEVFDLDKIKTGARHATQQADYLGVTDLLSGG